MKNDEKRIEDEGPRSAAVLLQQISDGELHTDLSTALQRVTKDLVDRARARGVDMKGSVSITLTLAASPSGTVAVAGDVKTKLPPVRRAASTFFSTKGGNLTVDNPKQGRLPLREVPESDEDPVDVPADKRGVRSV